MFEVSVEETFAAGHALRNYHGKCETVHGHNYKVEVTFQGERLNAAGLLIDFVDVKRTLGEIIERLDHRFLNDMPPFDQLNPSAENLARYFFEELNRRMAPNAIARVAQVRMWETDSTCATYRPGP